MNEKIPNYVIFGGIAIGILWKFPASIISSMSEDSRIPWLDLIFLFIGLIFIYLTYASYRKEKNKNKLAKRIIFIV